MCVNCSNSGCGGCNNLNIPIGPAGENGWSPQYQIVADGAAREVMQLIGWSGGTGSNPGHIGEYLATAGGYTATLALGRNIRGSNGSASTVIFAYNDLTGVGNDAPIGATTVISAPVPANTLSNIGDELDIDIYYDYYDNDDVVVGFKFGGSTIQSYHELGADPSANVINIKISMISVGTQMWTMTKQSKAILSYGLVYQTNSSVSTTTSNTFDITINNLSLGADQIVVKKLVIKKNLV